MVRQPARCPASICHQRSPTMKLPSGQRLSRWAARISMPGLGLRQDALVLVVVGADLDTIKRQAWRSGIAFMASPVTPASVPRATSGWLVTTISRKPAAALARQCRPPPGTITNSSGSGGVGLAVANDRLVEHAVAVEEHRACHTRRNSPISHLSRGPSAPDARRRGARPPPGRPPNGGSPSPRSPSG